MAKLPTGRYCIVELGGESGIEVGSAVDSMQLKAEIPDGVYPAGTIIQHVLSGRIFKINIRPQLVPFKALTRMQKDRAERYRKAWWPNPQRRSRPKPRKRM